MAPKKQPWISVVTRRIAEAPTAGVPTQPQAMAELSASYPQAEWNLVSTHYVGVEPGGLINVMFVFTRKEAVPEKAA